MISYPSLVEPPFLELEYYVGRRSVRAALHKVVPNVSMSAPIRMVTVTGLIGISSKAEEAWIRRGLLLLRTEGEVFCGPTGEKNPRAPGEGLKAYRRFIEVAKKLQCPYGAILVEYTLEEPAQLIGTKSSRAFSDFFVSRVRFSPRTVDEILKIAGGESYVETWHTGVYVSMYSDLNPERRSVDPEEVAVRRNRSSYRKGPSRISGTFTMEFDEIRAARSHRRASRAMESRRHASRLTVSS